MILQALVQEYEQLVRQGKLDRPGWSPVKVSFALDIDAEGHLLDVMPMKQTVTRQEKNGKVKETQVPRIMKLPTPEKRASGIAANFLCDNSLFSRHRQQRQAAAYAGLLRSRPQAAS